MKHKKSGKYLYILLFFIVLTSCNRDISSNESVEETVSSEQLSMTSTISAGSEEVTSIISSPSVSEDISSAEISITDVVSSEAESLISTEDSLVSEKSEEQVMNRVSYTNPVYNYDFPDPAGVYDPIQNAWFLFATGGQILRSTDGVSWTKLQNAFVTAPQWGTQGAAIWAPEVQYIAGQYVMYYSLSVWGDPDPGIGVATAPRPQGPWLDRGKLFRSLEIGVNNSIDPGVFVAGDGRVFMVWGSMRGNFIVELTSDGLALKAGSAAEASSEKIRIAGLDTTIGWTVDTYEAAYVRFWHGYYYLFLSMGTCCDGANSTYEVVVGRSPSPTGPYIDHLGRELTARNVGKKVISKNAKFVGTGHNSVIDDVNGEPWFYYHAFHNDNPGKGRVLLMERLLFDNEGWPYVSGFTPSTTAKIGPYYYL